MPQKTESLQEALPFTDQVLESTGGRLIATYAVKHHYTFGTPL